MNQIYNLKLPVEVMAVINKGLMLVPYGEAAPVINLINTQVAQSLQPKKPRKTPVAK